MQFQVLVEGGQAEKFLQRRLIHLLYLAEAHVMVNQREYLIGSSFEKRSRRRISAPIFTPTSTCPSKRMRSGATRKVGGLPTSCSSVPQASVFESAGGQLVEQEQSVHENIALRMVLRRLLDSLHSGNFG